MWMKMSLSTTINFLLYYYSRVSNVVFAPAISSQMARNGHKLGVIVSVWPSPCLIAFFE
jgi:hypothetical protein